jgi:hypothetical protein
MAEIPPVTERQVAAFRRFVNRLPHGRDIDLVILKAHLLMEEQINAILRERLQNPDMLLREEKFESYYRIRLAQSFFEPEYEPWVWETLVKLNSLRNRVAHNIDPKGRDDRMKDIADCAMEHAGPIGQRAVDDLRARIKPNTSGASPAQVRFESALWILFEAVSAQVEHNPEVDDE